MRISDTLLSAKSTVAKTIRNSNWKAVSKTSFIQKWLPILLGLGLGSLLALLIVNNNWTFVFALLLLVPLTVLFNAYPFVTVIVWLLVTPFFVATPTTSGRYVHWIIHRAMIPVGLGIVVLFHLLRIKEHHPVRLGLAELTIGIFVGLVLVSIFLFQPYVKAPLIKFYDRILIPYCIYLLVRLTTPREKDMEGLLVVALIVVVSQSVIGLLSWFAPHVLPSQWLELQGARTTGSLRQPGVYTVVLVFSIVLLFQAAMHRKPGLLRSILLFTSGLGAVCVFLSFSRGSWLGGLFVVAGLLVLFPKPTMRMAIILLVIMIVLGSGVLSSQMTWASERLETERTAHGRIVISDAMFTMVQIKPFFGWGYETSDRYTRQFLRRVGNSTYVRVDLKSHHTYLTIMAEMGLIGFFFYMFPFAWWLVFTCKVLPRMPGKGLWSRSLLIVLWLSIINHVVVSNFIDMRFFPFGLTLWWMTLGFIANIVDAYLETSLSPVPVGKMLS